MNYKVGQLLYNPKSGNIWIVTNIWMTTPPSISLVYDIKKRAFSQDITTKIDTIKPNTQLLPYANAQKIKAILSSAPPWVVGLVGAYPTLTPTPVVPPGLKTLTPAVVKKVEKALGVDLTSTPVPATLKPDASVCPSRKDGRHEFVPYTGLLQSFTFCIHCDMKRS